MPKVSVVVPIYNAEKYLEQCLYSIVSQTLRDIEIILVDDGSTDSSSEICDKYALLDNRIKVLHKPNEGLGITYNKGIAMATGEYVGFVEADDFIQKNMYEDLYNISLRYNPDIVKSAWFNFYEKQNKVEKDYQMVEYNSYEVFNLKEKPWLILKQPTIWSAIDKRDFLINNNVRCNETPGASYQDVGFTYLAFCLASSIVVTPDAYLYYRKDNENSSVNSLEKSNVIFEEYQFVDEFLNSNPEIKNFINSYKFQKQFYDYKWNYHRIAQHLKPNFLKRFAKDFLVYENNGELNFNYLSNEDFEFLNTLFYMT